MEGKYENFDIAFCKRRDQKANHVKKICFSDRLEQVEMNKAVQNIHHTSFVLAQKFCLILISVSVLITKIFDLIVTFHESLVHLEQNCRVELLTIETLQRSHKYTIHGQKLVHLLLLGRG